MKLPDSLTKRQKQVVETYFEANCNTSEAAKKMYLFWYMCTKGCFCEPFI